MIEIVTASCQEMLKIFRKSTSTIKLNNSHSFFHKLPYNSLIKSFSLLHDNQQYRKFLFFKKNAFAGEM